MTLVVFHDFPGLENGLTKFHDFPRLSRKSGHPDKLHHSDGGKIDMPPPMAISVLFGDYAKPTTMANDRQPPYDFLLTFSSNHGSISLRFRDNGDVT